MKRILYIVITAITISSGLFSCEPVEDRNSLPAQTLTASTLKFSVKPTTENPNVVVLKNEDPAVIPYWKYVDKNGNEIGHSNKNEEKLALPFAGKYTVYFTAYARGGSVEAAPVTVDIAQNDETQFGDPKWGLLANGAQGKTWILDMDSPVGFAGLDYPAATGDNWNWFPDYASNSWIMPNKNWGEMHFDLNGGYNTQVKQTAIADDTQTNKTGTFTFDMAHNKLIFNGGVEMLYGGDYYGDVSNWYSVKVVELTATSLRLAVIRDQSRKGEGAVLLVFHYKPKP
ncbi:hypothetical protein [uncultured Flavobacterium sp.]|uniref:hypothetical protein n=1 Tax=uncultured Flavobacterium sp. TaxID=165435 RepID=UPI002931EB11|nr:hypothetical protein [uncultured Flavobacterium sp.]